MAKLKANGRELARVRRIEDTPNNMDTVRRETTFVLMSNCRILKKLVVVFRPPAWDERNRPRRHDYGWVRSQLASVKGKEPDNDEVERWVALLERNGYSRVPAGSR